MGVVVRVGRVGLVELVLAGDQQDGGGDQGSEGAHGEAAAEAEQHDLDAPVGLCRGKIRGLGLAEIC